MIKIKSAFILFCFVISYIVTNAQCAMCKAVVEADLEAGGSKGAGLNDGILYLMAIPYLAIFCFGIFYYFQKNTEYQKISSLE